MRVVKLRLFLIAMLTSLAVVPAAAQEAEAALSKYLAHPAKVFVLANARLIDGTGAPARENVTILVEDGRVISIGRRADYPDGAHIIDLKGHSILPGLVMMHEHINYFSGAYVWDAMPGSVPKLLLAAGVTTARTAGSEAPQVDLNLKRRIDDGREVGPRLFVTGAYLNGPTGGFLGDNVVQTAADARDVTTFWGKRGATSVKAYSAITPDALRGAFKAAETLGMHVAGHLGEISCTDAATAGIHTIEHGLTSCAKDFGIAPDAVGAFRYDPASPVAQRLISLLTAKKIAIVSTPTVTGPVEQTEEELSMLSPDQRPRYDALVSNRPPWLPSLKDQAAWDAAHRAFERDFFAKGGRLLVGADASDFGAVPGYANHDALVALVESGFTPLQVLRFATHDAADFLGAGNRFGTVAPGMIADLLVVKGAPDKNIADIRNVVYVFKEGRAFDPGKLRAAAKGQLDQH